MVRDIRLVTNLGVRDAAKGFLISLRASQHYSPRYLDALEDTLALFAHYAEAQDWPAVGELTASHVEEYLVHLQTRPCWFGEREKQSPRPVSPSTVETAYRRIKRFFGWQVERGHIDRNPLDLIPHPKLEEKQVMPLSDREQAALVAISNPKLYNGKERRWRAIRNRATMFLYLDTLGRRDEIGALRLGDIDQDRGEIKVMGKGRKERWMALGERAQAALWEYLQIRQAVVGSRHDWLWVDAVGKRMLPSWPYRMLKRMAARAGIPDFHTHRTRHNYTIRALRAKMPIPVLERAGGWTRIPPTYLKAIGRDDVREFHRQVSPLDTMERATAQWAPARGRKRRGRL